MRAYDDFIEKFSRVISKYHLYTLLAVLMVIISNVLQFSLKPAGFIQGDSWGYGFSNSRNWKLVSFTGHALRKWPLVLVNTIIGNIELQIALQFIFSCLAWIFLIYITSKFYGSTNICVLVVGILGSLKQIISWNSIQLSESWALSSVVVVIGLAISISHHYSKNQMLLLLFFILISVNTKPSTLIGVSIFLPFIFFMKLTFKRVAKPHLKKSISWGILLIIAYSLFLNLNQANQNLQNEGSGQTYAAAQATAVISDINPEAVKVVTELKNIKEISCLDIVKLKSPIELTELMKHNCPKAERWLTNNFSYWYLKFLLMHPSYAAKLFTTSLSGGNSPYSMYAGSISIIPTPIEKVFFGNRNYANRLNQESAQNIDLSTIEIVAPIFLWLITGTTLVVVMLSIHKKSEIKINEFRIYIYSSTILIGLFTILNSSVLIPNEWFRQSIVGQLEIFLGIIFLFAEFTARGANQLERVNFDQKKRISDNRS